MQKGRAEAVRRPPCLAVLLDETEKARWVPLTRSPRYWRMGICSAGARDTSGDAGTDGPCLLLQVLKPRKEVRALAQANALSTTLVSYTGWTGT